MPVTTVVIVIVLALVLLEELLRRRSRPARWTAFAAWLVAGFLSALSTISVAIGLLVLPFALVAIVAASRLSTWPTAIGFVGGVGLVGILVSALNFGEPSSPDYDSWLVVGAVMTASSVAAFVAARSRGNRKRRQIATTGR